MRVVNIDMQKRLRETPNANALRTSDRQRGSILILLALLIPSLMIVMSLTVNTSYSLILRGEMQAASDASAIAGASALDGTQAGWDLARNNAINALHQHQVHGGITDSPIIPASFVLPADSVGPGVEQTEWNGSNYLVTVKRGRWRRTSSGISVFESMENSDAPGGNWQNQSGHTGLPRYLAANAVQVSVGRASVGILFPVLGAGTDYRMVQSATATASDPSGVEIAPFALPVCALATGTGDLAPTGASNSDGICRSERYFTQVNGYPEVGGVKPIPDFNYQPSQPVAGNVIAMANTCQWKNSRFYDPSDQFGVVGLAGETPTEDRVRDILGTGNGTQTGVRVGDQFEVLGPGLVDPATNAVLTKRIMCRNVDPPGGDPAQFESGANIGMGFSDLIQPKSRFVMSWSESPVTPDCPADLRRTFGLCNSRRYRMKYGSPATPNVAEYVNNCTGPVNYFGADANCTCLTSASSPVWRVFVPVISDPTLDPALGCRSASNPSDHPLNAASGHAFEIVGFVRMTIFDTDVGDPPPVYPTGCTPDPLAPGHANQPWGFEIGGALTPCNLVRGRVDCATDFVSVPTDNASLRNAVLVENGL